MADAIPGARYVEVPGIDHILWVGDAEQILDEVEEFLTGARHATEADRVLATVMFTDIVDSTRRAAELGDSRWRALVESHDQLVRDELDRYRGREIKTMGDGFLVTFDGPARGIRCARAITQQLLDTLGRDRQVGVRNGYGRDQEAARRECPSPMHARAGSAAAPMGSERNSVRTSGRSSLLPDGGSAQPLART